MEGKDITMKKWEMGKNAAILLFAVCIPFIMFFILNGARIPAMILFTVMVGFIALYLLLSRYCLQLLMNKDREEKEKMQQKQQELWQMASSEREKLRSAISHSLRMPLSIITGYSELLKNNILQDAEEQKECIDKINNNICYLNNTVSNLLLEVNADKTLKNFCYKKVDIVRCIEEIIRDVTDIAKKKNSIIRMNLMQDTVFMYADITQIKKLFYNLFENSFKYMKRAGVINITISRYEKDELLIVYKDDGEGMASEEIPYIFEANYQGSNSVSGSGMGMYFVKEIVKAHNGRIEARSEKNKGMCIYIRFLSEQDTGFL